MNIPFERESNYMLIKSNVYFIHATSCKSIKINESNKNDSVFFHLKINIWKNSFGNDKVGEWLNEEKIKIVTHQPAVCFLVIFFSILLLFVIQFYLENNMNQVENEK